MYSQTVLAGRPILASVGRPFICQLSCVDSGRVAYGEMAEWLKAPRKRHTGNRVGGSNPSSLRHSHASIANCMQKSDLPLRLEIQPKGRGSCSFVILRQDGTVAHISPFAYASVAAALAEGTEAVKQFTASMSPK